MFHRKLTTGAIDPSSPAVSSGDLYACLFEVLGKSFDGICRGGCELEPGTRVPGNEVDDNMQRTAVGDELSCCFPRIIDPGEQDIFEGDPSAGRFLIGLHGSLEFFDRIGIVDRHEGASQLVICCSERDGQFDMRSLLGKLSDALGQTAG